MKALLLALTIVMTSLMTQAQTGMCNDPLNQSEVCYRMQHLRATVNALDAQRDLLQVNYPYIAALGASIKDNSSDIISRISIDPKHVEGLRNVNKAATAVENLAKSENANTFMVANSVRNNCMTCHSAQAPASGIKWDDIFNNDWDSIVKHCNSQGHNPYICKSMNGMLSAYAYMLTAFNADIKNYELTGFAANEILRILTDLKTKKLLHMNETIRAEAEAKTKEIIALADAKDPLVFEKAYALPQTCMSCHDSQNVRLPGNLPMSFKLWNKSSLVR